MSIVVNRTIGLETCTIENWRRLKGIGILGFIGLAGLVGFAGFGDHILLLLWIDK